MRELEYLHRLMPTRRTALTRFLAKVLLAASMTFILTACQGEAPPGNSGSGADVLPEVTAEAGGQPPDALNELQSQARGVLAARLSVPAESLALIKDEGVQWPDASLGCPQEGMAYAQIITSGHRMTFRHGEDTYEVHTAAAGSSVKPVSCEGGSSY